MLSKMTSAAKKIIILGSGWSSYSVLKNINRKLFELIVVSPRNHFLFTPLLCSTTVGTLEFRSIIEPVRNIGFHKKDQFHLGRALSLDPVKKQLTCESVIRESLKYTFDYDKLIIGVGCLNNTFGVPGVREHACFLKELVHAREIRNRILSNFELSLEPGISVAERMRLLHTVIVGGGPTGIEFGAELYDFVQQDVSRIYKHTKTMIRVTLVESMNILQNFDNRLRSYAEKKIEDRERFYLVKASVTEVKADRVILSDGSELPCGLIVWSTGLSPQDFTKGIDLPKSRGGQILVDNHLRVKGDVFKDIYAIGDCACIEDGPLPATAQVAERQGRYLAQVLSRKDDEKEPEPFVFKSMGMQTYIGGYKALTDLPDFKLQGVTSWFLWRSAYLTRLGSWRLRMQVPVDWLKTLIFGRDTSKF